MRILSTGDWHFNSGYDADVESSVRQIINYVKENHVDLIANTGDVYERASEPGSRNLAADLLREMAEWAPILIVRGNHDAPGDLDIFSKIRSKHNIQVHSTPGFIPIEGYGIHTLPWLTKARWQSLHPDASKEEGDKTVSQLLLEYLKTNVALRSDCKKHILIGHCLIAGAKAQNHQQMGADGVTLGQYDLEEMGFVAAFLGHIHLKQWIGNSCRYYYRYYYNGSIAALEYGETPDKYFSVFDTNSLTPDFIKLNTIHRQDIEAEWTPEGISIINEFPDSLISGARIRANLRIQGGDNIDQAKKQLEEWLESHKALEYTISPQVIPVSKIRAVEITSAQTLHDKLRMHWKATNTEPEEDVKNRMLEMLSEIEDLGI